MVIQKELIKQPRIGVSGNILPDRLPKGEIFKGIKHEVDGIKDGSWRLGTPLGVGGFGEIYMCSHDTTRNVDMDSDSAMKVEPHANGPLFIERNFYVRAVVPTKIEAYRKTKNPKSIGIPAYKGSGSHLFKGDKYRFLVMDRLGKDLDTAFLSGKRTFPPAIAYHIALKVFDTLEYIHDQGYAHNDIKAQNLLLGPGTKKEDKLYLVDFGLVSRYHRKGIHLQYEPDDRKAHDGTIAYTSRDAHIGAHARRSDLEMLGYNLVHWMSGKLPWMDDLSNYEFVHMQKNGFMEDIKYFLTYCFGEKGYPNVLYEYLSYVMSMEFDTTPDYKKCRMMFERALEKQSCPRKDVKLDLTEEIQKIQKKDFKKESSEPPTVSSYKTPQKPPLKNRKRRFSEPLKPKFKFEIEGSSPRKSPRAKRKRDEMEPKFNESPKHNSINSGDYAITSPIDTWAFERVIGSGNCELSELLLDHDAIKSSDDISKNGALSNKHLEMDKKEQKESLENPTPAMKFIMKRIKEKDKKKEKEKTAWKQKFQRTSVKTKIPKSPRGKGMDRSISWDLTPNPLTPAMEEIMRKQAKSKFRRRFRSTGDTKDIENLDMAISPCNSEDDDNKLETKSCIPIPEEDEEDNEVTFKINTETKEKTTNELSTNVEKPKSVVNLSIATRRSPRNSSTNRRKKDSNKCAIM